MRYGTSSAAKNVGVIVNAMPLLGAVGGHGDDMFQMAYTACWKTNQDQGRLGQKMTEHAFRPE